MSLVSVFSAHPRTKQLLREFMRKYTSDEEVAFGQTLETSARRSPAEGRALPLHTAAASAAFTRRVAAVCPDAASWRADPQALWTALVAQFGVRHHTRKVQRIQRFIIGFSPVVGENIVAYLSRFEAELAAIEDESPNVLGGDLALPVYLKTALDHIPQCRLVFAKMATKSHADYEKYKRYLIQSFEDIHSGRWTLHPLSARAPADHAADDDGVPPGTVAGVLAHRSNQGAPNGSNQGAPHGRNRQARTARRGDARQCYQCGSTDHLRRDCPEVSAESEEAPSAPVVKCKNCGGAHLLRDCTAQLLKCAMCEKWGHLKQDCLSGGTRAILPPKPGVTFKINSAEVSAGNPTSVVANSSGLVSSYPYGAQNDDAVWSGTDQDPSQFHMVASVSGLMPQLNSNLGVSSAGMLNEVSLLREELTHARAALARGAVEAKAAEARAAHAAEAWRVERAMMVAEMARVRLEASRSAADVKLCEVEEWRAQRGVPVAELVCKRVDALWSAPDLMSQGVRLAPELPSRVALDICQNVTNRVFDPGTGLRKL